MPFCFDVADGAASVVLLGISHCLVTTLHTSAASHKHIAAV